LVLGILPLLILSFNLSSFVGSSVSTIPFPLLFLPFYSFFIFGNNLEVHMLQGSNLKT